MKKIDDKQRTRWFLGVWSNTLLIFLLILTYFGIYPLIVAWDDVVNSYFRPANTFLSTSGKVVSSDVIKCPRGRLSYLCSQYAIQYNYKVEGVEYAAYRVNFESSTGDSEYTYNYWTKYRVGQTVTVFYDKDNPALAVLEPNVKRGLGGISLLMTIVGIVGTIWTSVKIVRYAKAYYLAKA